MFVLTVFAHVKEEFVEAFRAATVENARESAREPGVARFDVLQQSDDPTRFALVEVYRDQGAPAKHKETPHYNAWVAKVTDMLAEPRSRVLYRSVFPDDSGW